MWTKENITDQSGKTVIVTGANTGIGFEIALAFYEAGANVTIACRNKDKAEDAINKMKSSGGKGTLEIGILDLTNLNAVKIFADDFKSKHQKLDILINNAGVMMPPATTTVDGFELQFGVNFLGHFALTAHLFPLLKKTPNARVMTLSSGAATLVDGIVFENLKLEKPYDAQREYGVSKLANVLFAFELHKKLKALNSTIISVAAHPGVVYTDLQRHIPSEILETAFAEFKEVSQPWQGALPSLFAATESTVKSGEFYGPDGEKEYTGYPTLSKHTSKAMEDEELSVKLWAFSEEITGLQFPY
ncbi:SDR family NAD(P)-dependent oxidoreductase [Flavobacterium sp. ANB]|uniref:oxidoreductase n=1 Tax=unclassified Flavobacterium TaxID=196869 RepID=UPI0012B98F12|nr:MULTISPECIES: oxidoreductase [unclassified Flavobacterium]MBF4515646.1 SDR family NAD(P)-dependent oxidoreductase [Flavobacterium sp. ANB]MTD68649.1 SDR family NAD(P)-dependent oxidoreductase [Flavobacterium sp. LC2016-13]